MKELGTVKQHYSSKLDVPLFGRNQNFAVNLTHNWTPNLALETRFVYNRVFGDPDRFSGTNPRVSDPPFLFFYIQNESGVSLMFGTESFGGPENFY